MIRPATKIALEVVAGLLAVALLLVGAAAWRLSEGPLPVSFLTPLVNQVANDSLPDNDVQISDMVIAWTDAKGGLELQAVDVTILDAEGGQVVTIPRLAVDFSLRSALAGRLVPKKLAVAGASLTLVRQRDGGISFGLNDAGLGTRPLPAPEPQVSEQSDALIATLLDAISAPEEGSEDSGRSLQGLSIRDAAITVFDQRSGGLWLASGVSLEFRNTPMGMAGVINAHVLSPGGEWDLIGTIRANGPEDPVVIVANVNEIRLPDFARTMVALEPLALIDAAVSGRVIAKLNRDGLTISEMEVNLDAGEGRLTLPVNEPEPFYPPKPLGYDGKPQPEDPKPPYTPRPWSYEIDSAHIQGRLTWPEGKVHLTDFAVKGDAVDLAVSGSGRIMVDEAGDVSAVRVDLKSGPLAINVPNVTVGLSRIDGLETALGYDIAEGRLAIEKAAVTLGEGQVSLSGDIADLAGDAPAVSLDGEITDILFNDLMQVWPPRVGHGAREWVKDNISSGLFYTGTLTMRAGSGDLSQTPLPDDAIKAELAFSDVTGRYLKELSPIRDGRGKMHLTGNSFRADITGGFIEPAAGGRIEIIDGGFATKDFHIRGNIADIFVNAQASMTAMLALLDEEPLGYTSDFGLDPRDVDGTAKVRISTVLPMRSLLQFEDVTFRAEGRAQSLSMPDLAEGVTLDSGDMAFDVNNTRLRSNGTMRLAGTPVALSWVEDFNANGGPSSTFEIAGTVDEATRARLGFLLARNINGALPVEATLKGSGPDISSARFAIDLGPVTVMEPLIGWRKEAGIPATLSGSFDQAGDGAISLSGLNLSGQGVQLQGNVMFAPDGALARASLSRLLLANGTELTATATRSPEDGILRVDVNGATFDARDFLDGLFDGDETSEDDGTEEAAQIIIANANVDRVILHNGEELSRTAAHLELKGGSMRQLSVDGAFATGGALTLEMKPTTYGTRTVTASSGNAGAVLRGLDLYNNVDGGDVDFDAEIDDRQAGSPLEGELTGENIRIRNAPVLASILTLGSLTGIRDTLQGDGILFTRLEAPVRVNQRAIDLKDAIFSGPAIGATIKGHVNRDTDEIDLGGTIVPAYTINSFLGNIPVLGDILVGREGEGLFGVTYRISGVQSDPEVTVNPLAALVPGIFRRLFEMGGAPSDADAPRSQGETSDAGAAADTAERESAGAPRFPVPRPIPSPAAPAAEGSAGDEG
ncbi:AsmA-like C-terminal region-containing protein [Pyruvatibacter mobilis]|uniref:YhdP family protein n=1 Tax=Pyruvatibacter mobilis TaxID=1712261 RepID=UPI003BADBB85